MSLIKETLENELIKHYSDNGKKIKQVETGILYNSAIDIIPCEYSYEETEDDIENIIAEQKNGVIENE